MRYPKLTKDDREKIRSLRIKGKEGRLTPDEIRECSALYAKYGEKQYDSAITDKEVNAITNPNPFARR